MGAYVIMHFIPFLFQNSIILDSQHGGIKYHSPETAFTAIQLALDANVDSKLISSMISTDLSAAYDTVDHYLLCHKIDHYGIRGEELELLKSYLSDRSQFVTIDGANSQILKNHPCSVSQGSKLAGTF